jgi:zinc transport system substrate-binding protein
MWAASALLVLGAVACGGDTDSASGVEVAASFYPLAFVAEEVGEDLVEVGNLTPPGAEPHDLELTPGQVRALAEADLVVHLGGGFQPTVEDAIADLDGDVVEALASQDDLLEASASEAEQVVDPHVWLDPQRTALIARAVSDRLGKVDPDNADAYRANSEDLQSRLQELDDEYREGLAECERRSIVTSHEAFGYLAGAYRLEQVGIAGIDPEAEPTPQRLAEVADFVDAEGVTTIFFEVLVPPDVAETLAREAGVRTARLDPLEGPPEAGDYFSAMRANLEALRKGLGCS